MVLLIYLYIHACIGCTSLLKLSMCRSWIPSSMLLWWAFLDTCRFFSRSARVIVLSRRPSTKCVWKNWEYCGRPTSFSHACATQWWSRSAAFDNLTAHTNQIKLCKPSYNKHIRNICDGCVQYSNICVHRR